MLRWNDLVRRPAAPSGPELAIRWWAVVCLGLTAIFGSLAGCNSLPAPYGGGLTSGPHLGVMGYTYTQGQGSQGFAQPAPVVREAVLDAMAELRIGDLQQREVNGVLTLSGITADRRLAEVAIVSQPDFSLVNARIGSFGDRVQTRTLFDHITNKLNARERLAKAQRGQDRNSDSRDESELADSRPNRQRNRVGYDPQTDRASRSWEDEIDPLDDPNATDDLDDQDRDPEFDQRWRRARDLESRPLPPPTESDDISTRRDDDLEARPLPRPASDAATLKLGGTPRGTQPRTAPASSSRQSPWISRDAVSDDVMLRDVYEMGYQESPRL
ncbi:hypothetical protein Isop_3313 [Isosphaera pallida ATCC 43644]|uniref:DUF3568 family protein n=1 Tax=Isosphaera pallida (strain ATCC 43644 / DSM 9630 / IS1B) TaxID=575540 RepID=E8R5X3_ISOPI|nr:hypothetical protein [Isosphaera pallida]ADV63875.1 hypothetical protein Isop_3313 [Isosphaera pallida ATCC 43644]